MPYSVTSWFQTQLEKTASSPKRQFLLGTSDYSDRVMTWPKIKRSWDEVRPQGIQLKLANEDLGMDFIHQDKTKLAAECKIRFGFTHPTSGDELITLFSGTMDKVRYFNGQCVISILDKFKQLSNRAVGDRDNPVTFTNSSTPADIAWTVVTSWGGYSTIASDSNPDIDYNSWLNWAAVFSQDTVYMNAHIEGKKCTDVLKRLSRYTLSAIYIENDRITFKRFSEADSNSTTLDADRLSETTLSIDDEDIVNKQYVYGAYNVDSKDWGLQVFDVVTASVNTYGLREEIEKDDVIWYVDSTSAVTLAQKLTLSAGEPYDRISGTSTLVAATRQIGETILFVDSARGINDTYRIMDYDFDLDKGIFGVNVDASQYLRPFILDQSKLDGADVLL